MFPNSTTWMIDGYRGAVAGLKEGPSSSDSRRARVRVGRPHEIEALAVPHGLKGRRRESPELDRPGSAPDSDVIPQLCYLQSCGMYPGGGSAVNVIGSGPPSKTAVSRLVRVTVPITESPPR